MRIANFVFVKLRNSLSFVFSFLLYLNSNIFLEKKHLSKINPLKLIIKRNLPKYQELFRVDHKTRWKTYETKAAR